jgi:hypothetical protein
LWTAFTPEEWDALFSGLSESTGRWPIGRLMQRIHNWKELHLCHPPGERSYIHIDSLFSTQVEWDLIETIATETAPKSAP